MQRTKRGHGSTADLPVDLFSVDAAPAAAYTMNLDPRQRTLDGFELPADVIASPPAERAAARVCESASAVREPGLPEPARPGRDTGVVPVARVQEDPASAAPGVAHAVSVDEAFVDKAFVDNVSIDEVSIDEVRSPVEGAAALPSTGLFDAPAAQGLTDTSKGAAAEEGPVDRPDESTPNPNALSTHAPDENAPNHTPPSRQTPARHPAGPAMNIGHAPDVSSGDPLAQTVAELKAALAEERRAAHKSRRQTTRLMSMAILLLLFVLVLGVVQAVVSVRASRESAEAQEKTGGLLRAQQNELAALRGAVSQSAKLAAPPVAPPAAQPPAAKRVPRTSHAHRATVKTRSSTADDPVQIHSPPPAAPWPIGTGSTTAAAT